MAESFNWQKCPEIASTNYNVVSNANAKIYTFNIWADNCSAQNKNWVLMLTFMILVNEEYGPTRVTVKYFEPGCRIFVHKECDAIHGKIGPTQQFDQQAKK